MKRMFYLFHGLIFSSGTAIILYVKLSDAIVYYPPKDIIYPTIFSILGYTLFVFIGFLISKNLRSAGLAATMLVLGFFYLWDIFLVIIIIAPISLLVIKIILNRVGYNEAHLVLNTISIAVVGYYLFQFIGLISGEPWASLPITIQSIDGLSETISSQTAIPDIYYIILDGYGRADMLKTVYGFDNSDFVSAIEQKGFFVASQSRSNYPRSLFSISSSLNLQYLETMSSVMGDSNLQWPVIGAIQDNEVRKILEDWGYKTVFFATEWDFTDIRDGYIYETPYQVNLKNFEIPLLTLTNLSIFRGIERFGIAFPSYDTHRRLIQNNFERLSEVAYIPGPKFVFAHVIALHPPYIFDRMGNPVIPDYPFSFKNLRGNELLQSRTGYLETLMFINQKVLATIDGILANSVTPPIIIIQGDHGPGILYDDYSPENSCLYERYSILNAYYLPGVDRDFFLMDISPVNSFRFIFNTFFHTDLELLPNRQFFSTNDHFYNFTDVTDQIQNVCNTNLDSFH